MESSDREFARVDLVRSLPDGPVMTVEEVYASAFRYRYRCVWTDANSSHSTSYTGAAT